MNAFYLSTDVSSRQTGNPVLASAISALPSPRTASSLLEQPAKDSFEPSHKPKQPHSSTPLGAVLAGTVVFAGLVGVGIWQRENIARWWEQLFTAKPIKLPAPPPSLPLPSISEELQESVTEEVNPFLQVRIERLKSFILQQKPELQAEVLTLEQQHTQLSEELCISLKKLMVREVGLIEDVNKLQRLDVLQAKLNPDNPLVAKLPWEYYESDLVDYSDFDPLFGKKGTSDDIREKLPRKLECYLRQLDVLDHLGNMDMDFWKTILFNTQPLKKMAPLYCLPNASLTDSPAYQQWFLQWAEVIKKRFTGELVNGFPARGVDAITVETKILTPLNLTHFAGNTVTEKLIDYLQQHSDQTVGIVLAERIVKNSENSGSFFKPIVWLKSNNQLHGFRLDFKDAD